MSVPDPEGRRSLRCIVCENGFEPEDMAICPAYAGPICSLCCSLDARCHDLCKPQGRASRQLAGAARRLLPAALGRRIGPRVGRYLAVHALIVGVVSVVLLLIDLGAVSHGAAAKALVDRVLLTTFAILFIVSGLLAWFFVLLQDSRRLAEEETRRQTALLEDEIAAHRRTDAELQRAKEVAEAANLAKSRYVVGLSHELRTPLNAVLGYAQLLERDADSATVRQNGVRVIRRSAEHLSGLIDGLLDVSKIEAGRLQIAHDAVRIGDLLDGVADMFRLQARARGLAFTADRPATLPAVVRTDEKRLRQILINLLSNAVKFTPAGAVGLHVSYRNQVARFTVFDSGPGIAPDRIERIFEPFDRGGITDEHALPGLGLGLTITKLLAELMGGDIAVDSTPGQGSRFHVRLMLGAVSQAAVPAGRAAATVSGFGRTILLADDDPDHQQLVRSLLEPLGFSLVSARDGATCLALVEHVRPDLFILDVSMPGLSGWELARALRQGGHPETPIVMLSAHVGAAALQSADAAVADAILPKPFDVARLLDTLGQLLKLEPAPAPPPDDEARAGGSLSPEDRAELERLAAIGHVRGLAAKLDGLAADPALRAAVLPLRARVDAFDLAGLAALLAAEDADE